MADGAPHSWCHCPGAAAAAPGAFRANRGRTIISPRLLIDPRGIAETLMILSFMVATPVLAQTTPSEPTPAADAASPARHCVEVDIAGYRAGTIDCAAARLDAVAKAAQERAAAALNLTIADATSADVVTGVANRTATRQRMGDQFGVGVRPQRPALPVFAAPIGRKP